MTRKRSIRSPAVKRLNASSFTQNASYRRMMSVEELGNLL
jgi:hypothetical protein